MTKRTLSLKRESLTELTTDDLTGVVGAAAGTEILSCPIFDCLDVLTRDIRCDNTLNCPTLVC
ncbi:MAG TPA: hypothetical protein VNA20_00810 [Frankiaceae bacterium]|nr:hypothetical protein [Frankiaceae bacterium]